MLLQEQYMRHETGGLNFTRTTSMDGEPGRMGMLWRVPGYAGQK